MSLRAVGPATVLSHKCDILSLLKDDQPKGPFRTKNSTALKSVVFCCRRSFSLSVLFSCLFFLQKQALLSLRPIFSTEGSFGKLCATIQYIVGTSRRGDIVLRSRSPRKCHYPLFVYPLLKRSLTAFRYLFEPGLDAYHPEESVKTVSAPRKLSGPKRHPNTKISPRIPCLKPSPFRGLQPLKFFVFGLFFSSKCRKNATTKNFEGGRGEQTKKHCVGFGCFFCSQEIDAFLLN